MQIKILLKKVTIPMGKLMKIMLAEEKKRVQSNRAVWAHKSLLLIYPSVYLSKYHLCTFSY